MPRIQQRRTKGWRMPADAMSVGRPSKWGNPFKVGGQAGVEIVQDRADAVDRFRLLLEQDEGRAAPYPRHGELQRLSEMREWMIDHVDDLRGKVLACWCPLDQPCHADVLLDMVAWFDGEATRD